MNHLLRTNAGKALGLALAMGTLLSVTGAEAHNTTNTCWEQWDSSFAIQNATKQFRDTFMHWTKSVNGVLTECTNPASQHGIWPGYASSCWLWRRRCGEHYIRLEDNAGEAHTWFEELGPTDASVSFCDPRDGKGPGHAKSGNKTPPCPNWGTAPWDRLKQVLAHAQPYSLIVWVQHRSDAKPVIFDLQYFHLPTTGARVSIKIGPNPTDWLVAEYPKNEGDFYWDVSGWASEIERVEFKNPGVGATGPVNLGGIYYSTPSYSCWPSGVCPSNYPLPPET